MLLGSWSSTSKSNLERGSRNRKKTQGYKPCVFCHFWACYEGAHIWQSKVLMGVKAFACCQALEVALVSLIWFDSERAPKSKKHKAIALRFLPFLGLLWRGPYLTIKGADGCESICMLSGSRSSTSKSDLVWFREGPRNRKSTYLASQCIIGL